MSYPCRVIVDMLQTMPISIELVGAFLLLAHIVIGFVATILISTSRTPSAAIAWVLAIIFIPFLGACLLYTSPSPRD